MGIKITPKAKATVTHEAKDKGKVIAQEVTQEDVNTPMTGAISVKPLCDVGFEASYTHNLGDFKSARVQVSLRVPCVHEEIDQAYDYAKGWVDNKLNAAIEELVSD